MNGVCETARLKPLGCLVSDVVMEDKKYLKLQNYSGNMAHEQILT